VKVAVPTRYNVIGTSVIISISPTGKTFDDEAANGKLYLK
jgi:hypothetical protein